MNFPVLNLPQSAVLNVLKQLDIQKLLAFSLLSLRSRQAVVLTNWKIHGFCVEIKWDIKISALLSPEHVGLTMKTIGRESPNLSQPPASVFVSTSSQWLSGVAWKNNKTVGQWLEHLSLIFHAKSLDLKIWKDEFGKHEIEMLVQGFRVSRMCLTDMVTFPYLTAFENEFSLASKSYDDPNLQKLLIQNSNSASFTGFEMITLDALLVNNSKSLSFSFSVLSRESFVKFLQFWRKGSNPRLEKLSLIPVPDEIETDECETVFEEIGAELVPKEAWKFQKFEGISIDDVWKVWRINKGHGKPHADVFTMQYNSYITNLKLIVNH